MKIQSFYILIISFCILLLTSSGATGQAQGTLRVNYQGQLVQNSNSVDDICDVTFQLFDAQSGGEQLGTTVPKNDIFVNNGVFNTTLDFGFVNYSEQMWLQIAVRCGINRSTSAYTELSPRQELLLGPVGPGGSRGPAGPPDRLGHEERQGKD